MNRHAVKSSQIREVGHNPDTQTLEIQFLKRDGSGEGAGIYRYAGVTTELYQRFLAAESLGKFFGQHIKQLPTTVLRGEEWFPIAIARASGPSLDLVRRLAAKAELWDLHPAECVTLLWRDMLTAAGVEFSAWHGRNVEEMLGTLLQPQASAMIEWLKGRA